MQIHRHLVCSQYPDLCFRQILFLHMLLLSIKKQTALLAHSMQQSHGLASIRLILCTQWSQRPRNPCEFGRHRTINFD